MIMFNRSFFNWNEKTVEKSEVYTLPEIKHASDACPYNCGFYAFILFFVSQLQSLL